MKQIISWGAFTVAFFMAFNLAAQTKFYDFKMKDIDGKEVSLSQFKGKVVMVVNVASKCGLTPQYDGLQDLYETYKDKGFVILAFPANNFMSQEPGTNADIKTFCTSKYNVTFPIFSKISVKGDDMHPLYQFLTQKSKNGVLDAAVSWNFQKFLIGKDGKLITSFAPKTKPDDASIKKAIEQAVK